MKLTPSEKRLIKRFEDLFFRTTSVEKLEAFLIKEVRRASKTYKQGYIDGYSDGWEEGREELL